MHSNLPLFHRAGGIVFLDDAIDYLELVGMVLPPQWHVELFSRPATFLQRMAGEPARWEADVARQLSMLDRHRHGQPLIPLLLNYWSTCPERLMLARVCVVDYAMPGADGLQVLSSLVDWPGSRVMLTGQAEDQIAIRAFNEGLIEQFVQKQTHQIAQVLVGMLSRLLYQPHARIDAAWRTALRAEQLGLLRTASVDGQLSEYARQHWVEHAVVDEPFGILGLRQDGSCEWMQLEPAGHLAELAELAASVGLPGDQVRDIEQARRLAAVELHQQLRLTGPVRTAPAFEVGHGKLLTAAVFPLSAGDVGARILPWHAFVQQQGERVVQDA